MLRQTFRKEIASLLPKNACVLAACRPPIPPLVCVFPFRRTTLGTGLVGGARSSPQSRSHGPDGDAVAVSAVCMFYAQYLLLSYRTHREYNYKTRNESSTHTTPHTRETALYLRTKALSSRLTFSYSRHLLRYRHERVDTTQAPVESWHGSRGASACSYRLPGAASANYPK